jgi:hypothetical protein
MIKIPSLCSQYAVNMQVQNGSSTTAVMGVRARAYTHRETAALARIPGLLTRHSPHK